MRDALNTNPLVQGVALGLLALAVAFLLFTRVVNREQPGGEPPPADPATATATAPAGGAAAEGAAPSTETTTPAPAPVDPAAPAPATDSAAAPATGGESGSGGTAEAAAAGEFVAGPGLPADVVKAYANGDVVVLLIMHEKGIDDRELERTVERLRSRGDTAVFVVPAPKIADYSRITRGVDVERTPALVVLQPRRLSDGGPPVASVSYGFRGPASVEQAVEDSLYDGRRDLPYYPQ